MKKKLFPPFRVRAEQRQQKIALLVVRHDDGKEYAAYTAGGPPFLEWHRRR